MNRLSQLAVVACLLLAGCGSGDNGFQGWTRAFHPSLRPTAEPLPEGVTAPGVAPIGENDGEGPELTPEPSCTDPLGCYGRPELVGIFDTKLIPQASGVAASHRNRDVLYLLDDAPGTTGIWAVRRTGEIVASLEIQGLDALDTESLAIGGCGDGGRARCLYIADIGDNVRGRHDIVIHRVHEPNLNGPPPAHALPSEAIRLSYPGQRHDAEALLVDDDGLPHVVTKAVFDRASGETGPTLLFGSARYASGMLEPLGGVTIPPPKRALASLFFGNVVTGGEAVPGRVLLRTYDHVIEFVGTTPSPPLPLFPQWQVRTVPSSWQPQAEAVTYAADGCGFYSVSEMSGEIWFTPCLR